MNPYTALTIVFTVMFSAVAVNNYFNRQAEAACYTVADTPAKLAICKGATYKEQQ